MRICFTRIASIVALCAVALSAQGLRPESGSGTTTTPLDPATVAAREVSFLTTLLTLSTAQAAQATTIFTTEFTSEAAIETQITTARTPLATAIKANATATIAAQATAIGTLEGQLVALKANADAAFYQLLTTDQKTKLDTLGADFFGHGLGDVHIPGGGH